MSDTRQKAGRLGRAALPGGVNVPAATDCAVIELTSFNLILPNCSQVIAGVRPVPWPSADAVSGKPSKPAPRTIIAIIALEYSIVVSVLSQKFSHKKVTGIRIKPR